jgi:hypothetical protein
MNAKQFAELIDGQEYPFRMSKEQCQIAKENGLIVAFGASDDLLELRGVIDDEFGAWGGTKVYFVKGQIKELDEIEGDLYYQTEKPFDKLRSVLLEWCPKSLPKASWLATVGGSVLPGDDIANFDILEDGEIFCRGVVFKLNATEDELKAIALGDVNAIAFDLEEELNLSRIGYQVKRPGVAIKYVGLGFFALIKDGNGFELNFFINGNEPLNWESDRFVDLVGVFNAEEFLFARSGTDSQVPIAVKFGDFLKS